MEKILVIQTAFIGDAILTLPMIQMLKRKYPESEIDVISIPATAEIFAASPSVKNVIILDKHGQHKRLNALLKFCKKIRGKNYSKLYSPHRSMRTALIVMQSGVKETYAFSNSSLKHVYKHIADYKHDEHEVQRNFDLINFEYGAQDWRVLPELTIPREAEEIVDNFFVNYELNNKVCAIAPGSVWNTKRYPEEYFEKVIEFFINNNMKVLLIGGDEDKSLCEEIAIKFNDGVISTAGKFTLLESIEILKRVKILVSNDSAPTHLGMCSNIPVLTLYCSTIADFGFYPYNNKSHYLSFDDLTCKPCGIHGYNECPLHTFDCGFNLSPGNVISNIKEILND